MDGEDNRNREDIGNENKVVKEYVKKWELALDFLLAYPGSNLPNPSNSKAANLAQLEYAFAEFLNLVNDRDNIKCLMKYALKITLEATKSTSMEEFLPPSFPKTVIYRSLLVTLEVNLKHDYVENQLDRVYLFFALYTAIKACDQDPVRYGVLLPAITMG